MRPPSHKILLPLALALAGCAAPQPPPLPLPPPVLVTHTIVERHVVTVQHVQRTLIPEALLHCPANPPPPRSLTAKAFGQYLGRLINAADTCRANLQQISKLNREYHDRSALDQPASAGGRQRRRGHMHAGAGGVSRKAF